MIRGPLLFGMYPPGRVSCQRSTLARCRRRKPKIASRPTFPLRPVVTRRVQINILIRPGPTSNHGAGGGHRSGRSHGRAQMVNSSRFMVGNPFRVLRSVKVTSVLACNSTYGGKGSRETWNSPSSENSSPITTSSARPCAGPIGFSTSTSGLEIRTPTGSL